MKFDRTVLLAIVALVGIAAAASAYYGYDMWKESQPLKLKEKDFLEMYYLGYYENETVFASSFDETLNITFDMPFTPDDNLTALKAYVGDDLPIRYPTGWTSSSLGRIADVKVGDIPGLAEALLGLQEGDEETIGPLSPEEAFGRPVEENIIFTSDFAGVNQEFKITNISDENLTLQWIPEMGVKFTLPMFWGEQPIANPYWVWENATEVIDMDESNVTILTTPTELDELNVKPEILKDLLKKLPDHVVHIVNQTY